MVKLKFIAPPDPPLKYSANVHSTGMLGFTIATAQHFKIDTSKSIKLAVNEDDKTDTNIYGVLLDKIDDQYAYKIKKNGSYHSVIAKGFFDELKMDYKNEFISYSITEDEIGGMKVLKFTRKQNK